MPGVTHQGTPTQYEDALHQSGDAGVMMLGVRNDSDAILSNTDLDYTPIATDDRAAVKVNIRRDAWTLTLIADETLNDSDKTLTVPANTEYEVLWIYIELATTATVGARQIEIDFRDTADDVIGQIRPNATQAASLTYYYMVAPALANQPAVYDTDHLQTPLPPTIFLPAGYDIRIFDNNAVDAAADDMVIQMMVAARAT